jgi:hypothetical protein
LNLIWIRINTEGGNNLCQDGFELQLPQGVSKRELRGI